MTAWARGPETAVGGQLTPTASDVERRPARLRQVRDDPTVEVVVMASRVTVVELRHPRRQRPADEGSRPSTYRHRSIVPCERDRARDNGAGPWRIHHRHGARSRYTVVEHSGHGPTKHLVPGDRSPHEV